MGIGKNGLRAICDAIMLKRGYMCLSFGQRKHASTGCYRCSSYGSCSLINTIHMLFRGLGGEVSFDSYADAYDNICKIKNKNLREIMLKRLKNEVRNSAYYTWCDRCNRPAMFLYYEVGCPNCIETKTID